MKIALLGDIALYGKYSVEGNASVHEYLRGAAEYLRRFDHVIGNLETPFVADGRPYGAKSAHIKAHPANAALLAYLGVDVVNLANNHIFDYGAEGYRSTLAALEKSSIRYFGVEDIQLELRDGSAGVALHGYCSYNTNPLGVSRRGRPGVNRLDLRRVEERLRENHRSGLLNIVSVHSGDEHVNYPSRDDIRMARRWAGVCPYVYYGHHPHVLQGFERYNEALIAYSLGNFCFDDVYTAKSRLPLVQQTENNRAGAILELEVDGATATAYRVTPLYAAGDFLRVGAQEIAENLSEYSAALRDGEPEYSLRRKALLHEFIGRRKAMRDAGWYLKRLNLDSVRLVARARYNRYRYDHSVRRLLAEED